MAQRHAYSQPIETYALAPHNRNIWPSPTPTANQYKHMAERHIIETYGHTIAKRRSFVTPDRFFCLCWCLYSIHYSCHLHPSRAPLTSHVIPRKCQNVTLSVPSCKLMQTRIPPMFPHLLHLARCSSLQSRRALQSLSLCK